MTLWKSGFLFRQGTVRKECNHCFILRVTSLTLKFSEAAEPIGEPCRAGSSYEGDPALPFWRCTEATTQA